MWPIRSIILLLILICALLAGPRILPLIATLCAASPRAGGGGGSSGDPSPNTPIQWQPRMQYLDLETMPRMNFYERRRNTIIHHGQRKLYLAELEFLTKYARSDDVVVYAGSAPGSHIMHLIKHMPNLRWVCVDPRPFDPKLKSYPCVCLITGYFDDEMAQEVPSIIHKQWGKKTAAESRVLFISDIRAVGKNSKSQVPEKWAAGLRARFGEGIHVFNAWVEHNVAANMIDQMRWVNIIQPAATSLKARFPWPVINGPGDGNGSNSWTTPDGQSHGAYLDGELFIQPRAGPGSNEMRLFAARPAGAAPGALWPLRDYDYVAIDEVFTYFNGITRGSPHIPCVSGINPAIVGNNYDAASEIAIHAAWLKRDGQPVNAVTITAEIESLSKALGRRPTR